MFYHMRSSYADGTSVKGGPTSQPSVYRHSLVAGPSFPGPNDRPPSFTPARSASRANQLGGASCPDLSQFHRSTLDPRRGCRCRPPTPRSATGRPVFKYILSWPLWIRPRLNRHGRDCIVWRTLDHSIAIDEINVCLAFLVEKSDYL